MAPALWVTTRLPSAAVAAALERLPKLQFLDLGNGSMGPEGAARIIAAVTSSSAASLRHLGLRCNAIESAGATAIAARLPALSALRSVQRGTAATPSPTRTPWRSAQHSRGRCGAST